ncbi:MAG TPA: 16S rRNA (adenine(1518)-N(6)/adenine(1519)-N(6))-dimethyltransferase RsmA [Candidatus Paceibacterota bacterium]|jgi:16S rRNA (adenine1518-N6/adenine1519-N6)-dimethyltransferase|nr:16S rRNA (adenine(1518)-N(6)/adenine(1519)-N(6))-dimethyltransferase RsmA [Candidatus Paceibacterota bacterium]
MKRTGARLGQHFLKHGWAARSLAHAVALRAGETFVEIGPGKGILTKELLALGPVVAVEKDEALCALLRETFASDIASGRLRLIEGDVRDFDPAELSAPYVVAANIPYYITGEIIRQFLTSQTQPRAMALLVQKEVAQRATSAKESLLSLSIKAYGRPKIVEKVPAKHFSPPPSVDSAILLIDDVSKDFFSDIKEDAFFELLHTAFAQKRKMLIGNLSATYDKETLRAVFALCAIDEKARAEDVGLATWKLLARELL